MADAPFQSISEEIRSLLKDQNSKEAYLRADEHYDTFEERLGRHHPHTIELMLLMSEALMAMGQFGSAADALVECRARVDAALYPEHPLTDQVHRSLARLYKLQGLSAEAAYFYRLLLDSSRGRGEDWTGDALDLAELYISLQSSGEVDSLLSELQEYGDDVGSDNSPQYEVTLGDLHACLGQMEEAADHYEAALRFADSMGAENNPVYWRTLESMNQVYAALGITEEREQLLWMLIREAENEESALHHRLPELLYDLAGLYLSMNDAADARKAIESALGILRAAPEENEPLMAKCFMLSGNIAFLQENFQSSQESLEAALELLEKLENCERDTAEVVHNLAAAVLANEAFNEARDLFHRACELRAKLFGATAFETISSELGRAMANQRLGNIEQAAQTAERCLEVVRLLDGDDTDLSEQCRVILRACGREDTVEPPSSETEPSSDTEITTIHVAEEEEGAEDVDPSSEERELSNLFNQAVLTLGNQDYQSAIKLLERTLKIVEEKSGSDHPDLHPILNYLAEANSALGRKEAASRYQERMNTLSTLS